MPVFLIVVLGIVQLGVVAHGRNAVSQAALAGAETAAIAGGSAPSGGAVAEQIARSAGLLEIHTTSSHTAGSVTVTVRAKVPIFFDIGQSRVSSSATMPREPS